MNSLFKSLILGVLLAAVGYVLAPMFLNGQPEGVILAIGLLLGSLAGGLLASGSSAAPSASAGGKKAVAGDAQSIFVGNLAFKARPEELRELFAKYGDVQSVRIMTDRQTRRPRGFAFVEMAAADAAKAIKGLDGHEFIGRQLRVSEGSERNRRN